MIFLSGKKSNLIISLLILVGVLTSLTHALPAQADTLQNLFFSDDLKEIGKLYGYPGGDVESTPTYIVARMVRILLTLMGILFLVLVVYGGILWMTAGGNEEQVKKATGMIGNAVIGLFIVFAAYVLTWFVVKAIYQATTGRTVPYSTTTWGF